ncbi:hypothetical protein ID866_4126 [Astraeus odoratus]|nr:hypothetical protein ID866_4126 [Astraeus odoratus]
MSVRRVHPVFSACSGGSRSATPLQWDIRYSPRYHAFVFGEHISSSQLLELAVYPPTESLRIVSDLLSPSWSITVSNPAGVILWDVLVAIYDTLHVPLTRPEWDGMAIKKRNRIEEAFRARCRASRDPEHTYSDGIHRIDCLLSTTKFAGLSSPMRRHDQLVVVLTLSRRFGECSGRH